MDKGKKRENLPGKFSSNTKDALKMATNNVAQSNNINVNTNGELNESSEASPALDAEFVDVYKGTNGVIYLFDMTKAWTFDYVVREIHRCPLHIPILILANHRDMGHHRVVTGDQVQGFIDSLLQEDMELNRKRTGQIRYSESSMRNGFGLRYLYKFFNLPYLHLQRETLLKQLDRNNDEIDASCQELDAMNDNDEYSYDNFLEMITNKRRMMAEQLSATKVNANGTSAPPRSVSMPANMTNITNDPNGKLTNDNAQMPKPTPSIIIGANNPLPPKFQQQFQKKSPNKPSNNINGLSIEAQKSSSSSLVKNIEDFIPDDGEQNMFRKFLDEPNLPVLPPSIDEEESEEDDTPSTNLVIAKYQEELDPEDLIIPQLVQKSHNPPVNQPVIEENENENCQNSEPEDNQNCKLTNIEHTSDNEDNNQENEQFTTNLNPVLNFEDIEALETLYIAKNTNQNDKDLNSIEPIKSEVIKESKKSTKTSNQGPKKKKKTKSLGKETILNGDIETTTTPPPPTTSTSTVKKKKSTKLKTKNSNKNNLTNPYDIEDDERKKLEEFLGPDWNDKNDSQDHAAYQMF